MPRNPACIFLVTLLLLLTACKSEPDTPKPSGSAGGATPISPESLAGTWSGEWGPSAQDRNTVTLQLKWDGANLTGTVNPGPEAVELTRASFNPATNMVTMEAIAKGRGGAMVHYMIDGKVAGNTITGSWSHDDRKGDFTVTKT